MPKHVNPIISEFFAFLEIPELGCQNCFDVLRVCSKDDALTSYRSLYSVRILSGLAYPNESIIAELETVISGHTGSKLNKKGEACANNQRPSVDMISRSEKGVVHTKR